jgi:CubicO group peptidase (beta-lactamase class C family)
MRKSLAETMKRKIYIPDMGIPMNQKIAACLRSCINDRIFPGCVVGTVAKGSSEIVTAGNFTYDPSSPEVMEDTVYDVASITKAIPTSCLALSLIEKGAIGQETRCIDIIPELSGQYRERILIKHLLTHTLDYNFRLSDKKTLPPQELLNAIFDAPLRTPPGTVYCYANATSVLLGLVVERVSGRRLDVLAEERFFRPLGMSSTAFFPDDQMKQRCAPAEIDAWRGREIRGEVHDESAWALRPGIIAGSAGLFSTVPDMLRFIGMLLNRGEHDGVRCFKPGTVALMHSNALPPAIGCSAALGWELDNGNYMGGNRSGSTFGKTGFTGCTIIADPAKNAGFVFLTNHTYPRRRVDRTVINTVRSRLAEIIM